MENTRREISPCGLACEVTSNDQMPQEPDDRAQASIFFAGRSRRFPDTKPRALQALRWIESKSYELSLLKLRFLEALDHLRGKVQRSSICFSVQEPRLARNSPATKWRNDVALGASPRFKLCEISLLNFRPLSQPAAAIKAGNTEPKGGELSTLG